MQAAAQTKWAECRVFEADAPPAGACSHARRSAEGLALTAAAAGQPDGKYFGNFPYPYMNGLLHLGHAFSLSKVEFATQYQRMLGKRVLFPFAFHCTGMPIKAAADKIRREMEIYGNPPVFPQVDSAADEPPAATESSQGDPAAFKGKKGKLASKSVRAATQWEIMRLSGVPDDEIAAFADPLHWLKHFPPLGMRDVAALGCGVDWRRSFITTDSNPFYDSFVRWQFNTLHKRGKVIRDKRYAVFSPLDGQPCADHDRASGEGVGPQEYTLIKLAVLPECLTSGALAPLAGRRVSLGAATLRPETMYGQTNCWVLPDGQYGAFELSNGEVLIVTHRAALNLSYQERMSVTGKPTCLLDVRGTDLIGLKLCAPLAKHEFVFALPMLTILTNKGTGIVTSVPSDAPDDFIALQDLKSKPALREKYGVTDEWVLPFEPVPIINIPEFGDLCAPTVCAALKIRSQNDRALLDEAKHRTYLKGFTDGVLLVGPHAGAPVREVKTVVRAELISQGDAMPYCEPETPVVSRSGDECVVALTDQWYLQYGEEAWRAQTAVALAKMDTVHVEARNQFDATLGWLRQWACSRSFGLGTRIPWDPDFLIESLSDSTIYMAYYTVAHLLQRGDLYGKDQGAVSPAALTDAVWDAIFLGGPEPAADAFPRELFLAMRAEFEFWYPFDLRVSGKDLIQNHLTFCLYSHTAIFPEHQWPRAMRCNGHLLLNGDKMSKSTGNFKTLQQACAEYGADAVRIALADAGDGMDDANFEEATANAAILRLTRELAWAEEVLTAASAGALRAGDGAALTFADRVFAADMDAAVHAAARSYAASEFRDALKAAYFDLHNARDAYRALSGSQGLHAALVKRYVELSARLLAPIAPHWAEHVWTSVLKRDGSVLHAGWPEAAQPDASLRAAAAYVTSAVADWRRAITKLVAPPKSQKGGAPTSRVSRIDAYVAPRFVGWQELCLKVLAGNYDLASNAFPADGVMLGAVKASLPGAQADDKAVMKLVMPFMKYKIDEARAGAGTNALALTAAFDEVAVLTETAPYIRRTLGLDDFEVHLLADAAAVAAAPAAAKADAATPGRPAAAYALATITAMAP